PEVVMAANDIIYTGGLGLTPGGSGVALGILQGTNCWKTTGADFPGASSMAALKANVYLGSRSPSRSLIKWDGVSWEELGSGIDGEVNALGANGNDLFVGGRFSSAGGKPSYGFAIWHEPPPAAALRITRPPCFPCASLPTISLLVSWPAAFTNLLLEETSQI